MTQRITKKDVERKFSEAAAAARAAGLNTDGWRFELGNASMGINYTLSTGQHGSSSVSTGPFDRIGGTAKEAYSYLEALYAAWTAVARNTPKAEPGWYVVDDVTGERVSRTYSTEDAANRICRVMNTPLAGGRYDVREVQA